MLSLCAASLRLAGLGVAGLGSINRGAPPHPAPKRSRPFTAAPLPGLTTVPPTAPNAADALAPPKKPQTSANGLNQTAKSRPIG